MGTFLRPCVLSFAGYLSLSIATMVVLIGQKGCHVRHTYRPDFLAGTASNPLYTSTQIVRHPPPLGAHQPQRAADIGVFPVIIAHPYRDAAFLPVHRDSSPTLNSLFSVLPRGGIQKMLDALSTTDREDGVGADVHGGHELVAQDLEAITAITAIHSDVYDLSEISTWPRGGEALHLLKNGMVVSPQQAMYMETAGLMTSMHTQGMRWLEGRGNGMLPNIGRCVKPIEHREGEGAAERKKREFRWLSGLSDYSTRSHLKGACLLSGQQDVVDVSTNHKASAVLFSSVNTMYTSLVVAWISASFSLFYCMNALLNGYEDLLIGVAVVWNVVLAATSLAPQWYGDYSIPLNNIVLGLVLLGLAVVVHCTWSSDSSARAFGAKAADPKAFFRAPRTDLYMANQAYMAELEKSEDIDNVRCIEYAITEPLLFASVLVSVAPSVPTGIVQLCYATMMGFHLLCIPLLRMGLVSGAIDQKEQMKRASQEATLLLALAAIALVVSSVATFLVYGHSYGRFSDPDPVVLGLVWTLAVLQLLRSILVIAEPILRSLSPLLQGPALEAFRRLSAPSHALLTFVMRFASIVMVMVATAQKRFPHADCNMWG